MSTSLQYLHNYLLSITIIDCGENLFFKATLFKYSYIYTKLYILNYVKNRVTDFELESYDINDKLRYPYMFTKF